LVPSAEDRIFELARRILTEFVATRPEYGPELHWGLFSTGGHQRRHLYPKTASPGAVNFFYSQGSNSDDVGTASLSRDGTPFARLSLNFLDDPALLEAQFSNWLSGMLQLMDSPFCFTADDDRTLALARRILEDYAVQHPQYKAEVAYNIFSTGSNQRRSLSLLDFVVHQYRVHGTATAIGRFSLIGTADTIAELEVNYDNGAVESDGQLEAWLSEELRKLA
jgi:hypothetical protein